MIYTLEFTKQAQDDIKRLKKSEPQVFSKLQKLLDELLVHPESGTGKPKILRQANNIYSRRITQKHRLVYSINKEEVIVLIFTAYGHYGDK